MLTFGSPAQDTEKQEGFQRMATKMIRVLETLAYQERLKEVDLFILEQKMVRTDLVSVSNTQRRQL